MNDKTKLGSGDDAEAMAKTAENSAGSAGTGEMSDNELEGVAGGIGAVRPLPRPRPPVMVRPVRPPFKPR